MKPDAGLDWLDDGAKKRFGDSGIYAHKNIYSVLTSHLYLLTHNDNDIQIDTTDEDDGNRYTT